MTASRLNDALLADLRAKRIDGLEDSDVYRERRHEVYQQLAGDKAKEERAACGEWCEGCPICFETLADEAERWNAKFGLPF